MFVQKTFHEMLGMLERAEITYYDFRPAESVSRALSHSPDDFRFWINYPGIQTRNLYAFFDEMGLQTMWEPVAELLGNAGRHGNYCENFPDRTSNGDPMKSLSVKVFTGSNGFLVRIRNEGKEFNYSKTLDDFNSGRTYTKNAMGGNGIRMLSLPGFIVSYEDGGRTSNFLYLV